MRGRPDPREIISLLYIVQDDNAGNKRENRKFNGKNADFHVHSNTAQLLYQADAVSRERVGTCEMYAGWRA
jgi:hypothetical protein